MNAKHLLGQFELLIDSGHAIEHLRSFVLDLAFRGLLSEPNEGDEPVETLVKSVKPESSLSDAAPYVSDEEGREFDIRETWRWVKLGAVTRVLMGQSPPGSTYNKSGEGVPLVNGPVEFTGGAFGTTVVNQFTTAPKKMCDKGDFLLCVRGSTTGRTNVAAFEACIGRGVAALQPLFPDQYIRMYVAYRRAAVIAMGRGIAFPSISRRQIEEMPTPLPPLGEQK